MKALFTKFRLSIYFFLACVVIQLGIIAWLYPSPDDFKVTETVTGLFTFDGGGSRTRATSYINGKSLVCEIMYLGPHNSACSPRFENQIVTAKLASYTYLGGHGNVVMEIIGKNDYEIIKYSVEQRIQNWLFSSLSFSIVIGLFFAIPFYIIHSTYFNKSKGKDGN